MIGRPPCRLRRGIDLAIGVLMQETEHRHRTATFSFLSVDLSQTRNIKLHDVAREIVESLPAGGESVKPAHFNERGQKPPPWSVKCRILQRRFAVFCKA